MRPIESRAAGLTFSDEVARATFLKMTPRKWRLVQVFERFLRILVLFVPPRVAKDPAAAPKRILVLEYWNLGDLAIVVPFLRNLRRAFPGARISLVVNSGLASFLESQELVDEFIPVRAPWAQHFSRWKKYSPFSHQWVSLVGTFLAIRRQRFDWALSGRMDLRDNFLLWLTGAPRRIGYGFGGGAFLLTDCIAPDLSRPHRADVWLHLLQALGWTPDRNLNHFRLTNADISFAKSMLREMGIPADSFLIGIHPGARMAVRRWGDERFAEVARYVLAKTGVHVLWFSDPGDPSKAPELDRCHSVTTEFSAFVALLSRCHLLVCNDSGPMHLANLLALQVVAVFGPQRPDWFGPRGKRDRVVIRPEFWCRPCFDYCIFDCPYCLRSISSDEVVASVEEALRELRTEGVSEAGRDRGGNWHERVSNV
jgi:heptosyltransferase-2